MVHTTKLVLMAYLTILRLPASNTQESPCPNVFRYRYDQQLGLYGEISIILDPTNVLQLNVQMSVGNAVKDASIGKIELARPKETPNILMKRQPLLYYLFFPEWTGIPPRITQILVNGNLVCSGPKIPFNLVPIITTVNLQHTLRINIQPLSSSNVSPENNIINVRDPPPPRGDHSPPREEIPDARFEFYDRPTPPPAPPEGSRDVTEYGRPRNPVIVQKNRFNFNPTTPPPNRFNFNPRPAQNGGGIRRGQNPADVYKENPFFRNITTITNTPRPDRDSGPFFQPTLPTSTNINTNPVDTSSEFLVDFPDDLDIVSKGSSQPTRPFDDVCGHSISPNHLIFDGHLVPRGAYPWLAAMFLVKASGLSYICSGSLISDRHVVTAAHCVETDHRSVRPNELVLILGKLNIQKWIPVKGEQIVEPSSIHVHPDYETLNSDADIAVLVLSDPLKFTNYIRPVCLWRGDTNLSQIVGRSGTVVGWGKDESGVLMTEEPKQTNLPIVSQEKCLASNYQFHYITSNRTFCAGFRNGTGPCNGDSGGGLVMKWEGRWILRGIVSVSISTTTKSCDLSNYVVFCDASKYTNWLLSFLK